MNEVSLPNDWMPLFEWQEKWHYPKQTDFIEKLRDYWEVLFVAGNGTGKTHILYWSLINIALGIHPTWSPEPPVHIKILVNDFEHGLEKIFKETAMQSQYMPDKTTIGRMLPHSAVERYWSRDDKTILLKNGSTLFFQTSSQEKKLHSGTNFDVLACDEEAEYQHYDESKRGLRTAKGGGKILHSFTPPFDEDSKNKGPTWTKFQLVDPFERGEAEDTYVIKAAMKDNPAITDEFIKRFSKGKTEQQLRIQLYGEYPTWGKLIFPEYEDVMWDPKEKRGHLLPYDFETPWRDLDCKFEMAVDWHGSKPCAIVWTYEYMSGPNKGDIVAFDELSPHAGKGLTITGVCEAIRDIEGHRKIKIRRLGDPKMRDKRNDLITGFCPWDEFRHNGIRLTEGWNREPYTGYSIIRDYLKGKGRDNPDHPRLFIRENCSTLRHNMKNYYNVAKPNGLADPDPKFSDYCVSLKYIVQQKARKVKSGMRDLHKWGLTSYGDPQEYTTYLPRLRG